MIINSRYSRKVAFGLSKRYNKIAYMLRIRHFRGRGVHSPFMYTVVRKALMNRRGKHLTPNRPLVEYLRGFNFSENSSKRVSRVYSYLQFESYGVYRGGEYGGEDLIVIDPTIDIEQFLELESSIYGSSKIVCAVFDKIYSDPESHKLWNGVLQRSEVVAVDLYYEGIVFFNKNLHKQSYKMKF